MLDRTQPIANTLQSALHGNKIAKPAKLSNHHPSPISPAALQEHNIYRANNRKAGRPMVQELGERKDDEK